VEFAKDRGIALYARATAGGPGETVVRKLPPRSPGRVAGVASETGLALVSLRGARETLERLLRLLDERQAGGKQLLFREREGEGGSPGGASLVLSLENIPDFASLRRELRASLGNALELSEGIGAVSAIGAGINADFANLRAALGALEHAGVPCLGVSTSSFRISVLTDEGRVADAVRALHRRLVEDQPA
jgi:aspartate kinase